MAVIKVGAASETELKEKKLRVEDAVNATKAAIEEGIVPGGGVTLLKIRKALLDMKLEEDEEVGAKTLYNALEKPVRLIVSNAGVDAGRIIGEIERLATEKKNSNMGFNVMTMKYVDMIEEGITDPAKVTRSAIQNAVSVATMILTTECLVTDAPQEKDENSSAGGMGGMGGMPGMM